MHVRRSGNAAGSRAHTSIGRGRSVKVTIIDYGMGNVLSVRRALEHCGAEAVLTDRPEMVAGAERLVLPGVGAFGDCMKALETRGLVEPIREFAASGRPFLGICVGMQILLDLGEEFGGYPGLGFIPGRVVQIERATVDAAPRKIPHIGWAPIRPPRANALGWSRSPLASTQHDTAFYFVHSFTARTESPADCAAVADYQGVEVTAAVNRDNITGTQFHPEKSGPAGLMLLKRFVTA